MLLAWCLMAASCVVSADQAQNSHQTDDAAPIIVRIGTGGSEGTYFPIGSIIANAITGSNGIHAGQAYEEPKLLAIAQRAPGSASNVADADQGLVEGALAQADVVYWAFNGTGPFTHEAPQTNIRGLATLYLESVHLVVRTDANIHRIEDLRGQRVSLDEQGSGTRLDMLTILAAYNLQPDSFEAVYLKTADAIDRLKKNQLDAIFVIAGYPVEAISALVAEGKASVMPIAGSPMDTIIEAYPYFSNDSIPENTYQNAAAIKTIGVPAQIIVNSKLDDELVYNITQMLWSPETLNRLSRGHPKGHDIALKQALIGMDVPLHPGAMRFYQEQGMLSP